MFKKIYLLAVLLMFGAFGAYAAHDGQDSSDGEGETFSHCSVPWPDRLFLFVKDKNVEALQVFLQDECGDVAAIFPELKPRIQLLVQNAEKKGVRLEGYQLQEVIHESEGKGGICSYVSRLGTRLLSRNVAQEETVDGVAYVRVESEDPRSSLTLKNLAGKTLLEVARAQEEKEDDQNGRECVALLERQPAALMQSYVQHIVDKSS